ncbi:nitrilase-related carbon-nitrogen hydrolase [Paenibacillus sp. N3.4]|uniref:nitrilase-related carbon-nitrogen hydrolase n=1 Tax=Paenibacillus sp. N3.4 TaxID=2603222 RepID=UPI00164F0D50|nr:nitrilase-related carbon-nitrogen hydrolase [Paenibacillus sp. N3.4]
MRKITLASVQYGLSDLQSKEQFWDGLASKIREAAEKGANLVVFPEYVTAHLLSLEPTMTNEEACVYLDSCTERYVRFFQHCSQEWQVLILGGTHVCKEEKGFVNKAFLFFPDGRMETQNKIHLTPEEQVRWPLTAGDELSVFETAWGLVAILTCYDIEFPELARAAAERGAELILCPSYTDNASGYSRVRFCAQARAIENQLFVVVSGLVGALAEGRPQVDQGYCQAGLFTPCDSPFAQDGVERVGKLNEDMVVMAEIDFAKLCENRRGGAVAPFYDRRPNLYKQQSGKMAVEKTRR